MVRWVLPPAVLLASLFILPTAIDAATPGSGMVFTAQPAGQKLAVVAFSPFCVVLRVGNTTYGMTTSYTLHQVALASTDATQPLVFNPLGKEDVQVDVSFDPSASPRAHLFRVPAGGAPPTDG